MSDDDGIRLALGGLAVAITDEQGPDGEPVDLGRWGRLVLETAHEEGVSAGTIDVLMVDVETITALNVEHMGAVGPTDVLSFPLDDSDDLELPGVTRHVGDIVLCPEIAIRQAPGHAGTPDAEFVSDSRRAPPPRTRPRRTRRNRRNAIP
ncbi:MAG: rRNA maturation RNase YbeY [Acidimicrobiales bacterium]